MRQQHQKSIIQVTEVPTWNWQGKNSNSRIKHFFHMSFTQWVRWDGANHLIQRYYDIKYKYFSMHITIMTTSSGHGGWHVAVSQYLGGRSWRLTLRKACTTQQDSKWGLKKTISYSCITSITAPKKTILCPIVFPIYSPLRVEVEAMNYTGLSCIFNTE